MSKYRIEVSASAEKQLRKLQKSDQVRVVRAIGALAQQPRPRGCRRLQGYDGVFRLRVGSFRIIYSIEDRRLLIIILKLGRRKDIYRQDVPR
jgi:mRNA interferase RelE/StbE